jgi:pimeloyl-ACP methyl ester carboxylesterase
MSQPPYTESITFRHPITNAVLSEPLASSPTALRRTRRFILLIHGFNINQDSAIKSYDGFYRWQRALNNRRDRDPIFNDRRIIEVYWPGDAAWKGFKSLFSPLFYPESIDVARDTARQLVKTILRAAPAPYIVSIDIVGHSMGCRIAVEVLNLLLEPAAAHIQIRRVVLMAAAIPTSLLMPGARARQLRAGLASKPVDGTYSLFSSRDDVLYLAFRLGQTLRVREGEGFLPYALGSFYWPGHPFNCSQDEIKGAGHSDYWGGQGRNTTQERAANDRVGWFLGLTDTRNLPSRAAPERAAGDYRGTVEPRPILHRRIGQWSRELLFKI